MLFELQRHEGAVRIFDVIRKRRAAGEAEGFVQPPCGLEGFHGARFEAQAAYERAPASAMMLQHRARHTLAATSGGAFAST